MPYIRDARTRGWFRIDNIVVDDLLNQIGVSAFAVYAILCRLADNESQDCFPSTTYLCGKTGLTPPTVRKAVKSLIDSGMIQVEQRYRDDGSQTSNLITLLDVPANPSIPPPSKNFTPGEYKKVIPPPGKNLTPNNTYITHTPEEKDSSVGATPQRSSGSFQDWEERLTQDPNKAAVIMSMVSGLFPKADQPSFGEIGAAGKKLGWKRLAQLLWEASSRPPVGSPVAFVLAIAKKDHKQEPSEYEPVPIEAADLEELPLEATTLFNQIVADAVAEKGERARELLAKGHPLRVEENCLVIAFDLSPKTIDTLESSLSPIIQRLLKGSSSIHKLKFVTMTPQEHLAIYAKTP